MNADNGQPSDTTRSTASFYDRMLPAGAASIIGAAAATALSLPLRSPDDLFANAASVAVASAIAGAVLGLIWALFDRFSGTRRLVAFSAFNVVAFLATVTAAVIAERVEDLSNVASFTAPIAGIVLAVASVGTPIAERYCPVKWSRYAVPLLAVALVVAGVLLTVNEIGFNEPPSLSLPPPP